MAVVIGKPLYPDPLLKLSKAEVLTTLFQEISKVKAEAERLRRAEWHA
jgi:hypothetical protein